MIKIKLNTTCNTIGDGYWSREVKAVRLTKMTLHVQEPYLPDDVPDEYGELRVFFDRRYWNLPKHGLIYTDSQWVKEFRKHLVSVGFSKASTKDTQLDYSEQGMQGDDYVSLDVSSKFIKAWRKQETN